MTEQMIELQSAWSFPLFSREREYRLIAKLFKSKLIIEDKLGNKIIIQKRRNTIKIDYWGNIDWIGE
jgi:hypothetical protein